ncbi:uncharacterized protein LOC135962443 [Calliphora vicina]|uniref:uncharacterized protein LOC135962443 n=1 Tax=Calliphora vicina TaxID=7373 RepID=UPI00325BCD1C
MKLLSRSTLGVIIGSLNVLIYFVLTCYTFVYALALQAAIKNIHQRNAASYAFNAIFIILMVMSLIMMGVSGLLVVGIVKRKHTLMVPWLILSGIGFVVYCLRFIYHIFAGIIYGVTLYSVVKVFIVGVLSIGLFGLIIWLMFFLFRDIRRQNVENACQIQYQSAHAGSIESFE